MKVIIAAAGTGGHINPGIAIANKIKEKNKEAKIIFVGTVRGLENDLVPRAGYELKTIEAYGISRQISIENFKKIIKTIKGLKQAKRLIKQENPDIVIGTGGYICGPIMMAATKQEIPTMLHESNAFPGVTVKMLSKKVDEILVGFEDAKERLPHAKKVVLTGNPIKIRKLDLTETKKNQIRVELGFDSTLPMVLVFGGSQGAQAINNSLIKIIKNKLNKNYQIMWAAGPKQYDQIKETLSEEGISIHNIPNVKIVPYIYNMEEVMNVCDMVVSRSGAMTITEISRIGKPAIFIPYPFAAENHQEYNAKVLEKIGAAKIILNKDLDETILSETIEEMIKDTNKLKQMGEKAESIKVENVEDKIYSEIEEILKI